MKLPVISSPEKQAAPAAPSAAGLVPLRVTVVISRFQGDEKITSLPYVLGVTANGEKTTMRMGVDVPVAQRVFPASEAAAAQSYSYRQIGTNIDCHATSSGAGLFQLALIVSDSSLGLEMGKKLEAAPTSVVPNVPTFRKFDSSFTILLRDGQTSQHTSATDPVTGEVSKIDVTLQVLK